MDVFETVMRVDPEIAQAMKLEADRQNRKIELIASENFVSDAVMAAMGSVLTNKYAEGYPAKRYYGGCEAVDVVESLCIERAKKLFGAEHANVQPHSGSQANMAVYTAFLQPGDTILGMSLAHGGHLTHGSPVNFSGKLYNIIPYGVQKETGYIDYDELEALAKEHKPKMIVAGASAYPRVINFVTLSAIAQKYGAYLMVDMAHIAGLIATGHHPSPVPYSDFVTSTTHKTLRGPRGGLILCKQEHAQAIDKSIFPGIQGGPLMHIIAAKAVAFHEALQDDFVQYSEQVIKNAKALSEALMNLGFDLVSGGTDNHLMLVDLTKTGVTGKVAEKRLDTIGVTCNKNAVPFDTQSPFITSGIRLGTPAVTTKGMKEDEMKEIAEIIHMVVLDYENKKEAAKERSAALAARFH